MTGDFRLRATVVQALPPAETFEWLPVALITSDGIAIVPGAERELYPGLLLPPLVEYQISEAGWATIVAAARDAGLLSGPSDFTGGAMPLGAQAGRLELVVDGRLYDLTGDPSRVVRCGEARCPNPPPGTPEAFAGFWARLGDLAGWLGAEAGAPGPHHAIGYAILVGRPAADDPLAVEPMEWPLDTALAGFGRPVRGGAGARCGLVTGAEADVLRPELEAATEITRWVDPATPNREFGLTVRPLLPGDADPCAPLVGG